MTSKSLVRISPLLLGRVADVASEVEVGSLIVQFAGVGVEYHDAKEWNVTHAILSNSLAVTSPGARTHRNQQVDTIMQRHSLLHIGWLRQASRGSSLGSLDIDTQKVYEKHFPDAFAALLDLQDTSQEPMVYFYCINEGRKSREGSFSAAQHIILDSSVPFSIIEVSLQAPCSLKNIDAACGKLSGSSGSRNSDETDTTLVEVPDEQLCGPTHVSVDDLMAVTVL